MATQFHELPLEVFPKEARWYIARLNSELRQLFALEGALKNPREVNRSDATVVRGGDYQVAVSRIIPSITSVVSGSSTVVGTPALALGTSNVVGTTTTALSVNSAIALFGTQAALGSTYVGTVGTSAYAARADHRHANPCCLTIPGTTNTITLTDDPTEGSLLAASSGFSASILSLQAPGATNPLSIGKYGNITLAGSIPTDTSMLGFSKPDFNEAGAVSIMVTSVTNAGSGGINSAGAMSLSAINGGSNTSAIVGCRMTLKQNNANASGDIIVFDAVPQSASYTGTRTNVICFKSFGGVPLVTGGSVSNVVHFQATQSTSLTSTVTNHYGFYQTAAFTKGTTRRSIKVVNSAEISTGHCIVGNSGSGFIVKDIADGNYYLIGTSNGVMGASSIGTSLPAT